MDENSSSAPTIKQVLCPVCNMLVDPREAVEKIEHGEHAHYFCSAECRKEFEADPKKFH
ncbi:MAG: YHS domain-containing protein [Thermoanaerobaculia bacterium]|nr:YHS domain-containing protein [Thermoanaerobaculia bacterium]